MTAGIGEGAIARDRHAAMTKALWKHMKPSSQVAEPGNHVSVLNLVHKGH